MALRFCRYAAFGLLTLVAPALRAQLQFDPPLLDFGRRPQNGSFTAEVRLSNLMARPVKILSVQGDCSCLTGEAALPSLAPGGSTVLTVHMQSGGFEGEYRHNIVVAIAGGASGILPVKMTVYRYAAWTIAPVRLIFTPSRRGTEAAAELRVTHVGADQPGVISISSDSPYLEIESGAPVGNAVVYQVKKLPDSPAGPIYSDIKIRTGDPASPVLDVPVFAYVTSGVEVRPNPIVMPTVKVGTPAVTTVRVSGWDGAGPARPELSGGSVRVESEGGGTIVLELTLISPQPGPSTHRLMLYDGKDLVIAAPVVQRAEP